jgi:hypothetical protein
MNEPNLYYELGAKISVTGKERWEEYVTEEFHERVKPFRDLSAEWKRHSVLLHLGANMYYVQQDKQLRNKPYGRSSAVGTK